VARVEVRYGDPVGQQYRDLWVVRFDDAGRCIAFEGWPFWPKGTRAAGTRARSRRHVVLTNHCE
jgi:hypothetical protein